jgi:excisionase family DNA binding protein
VQPVPETIPLLERRALRVNEATSYAGLGKTRLYEMLRSGEIASVSIGKRRLVLRESLDGLLTPQTNP